MIQIAANSNNRIVIRCDGCGRIIKHEGYTCDDENGEYMHHWCEKCTIGSACAEFRVCDCCGLPMVDGYSNDANFYTHYGHCFEDEMNRRFDEWERIDEDGYGGEFIFKDQEIDIWHSTGIKEMHWY